MVKDHFMLQHTENWDDLAKSIADGEAILVLGPNAIPFYSVVQDNNIPSESTFSQLSQCRIAELGDGQINHFYLRDSLFQFRDAAAKHSAMKCVREVARDRAWLPDAELMRQIVQLPFPIILSLNPDKYLYEAFVKHWREPQFDYFTTKGKPAIPNLKNPDADNPLIFNLCGSVQDKLDSVLLDYHDLFEFLKNMLSDHGVPEPLSNKLGEVDRYILLGFDLERWDFQMFLHYINKLDSPFNNFNQTFPILSQVGPDSTEFVMRQFNIKHIAPNREEFEYLFDACKKRGILRKIQDPSSPIESKIQMLAVQGKFGEAFQLLAQHASEALSNHDIPHLQGRYNTLLEQENAGIISLADALLERNRIRYTLLTFANQLPKP